MGWGSAFNAPPYACWKCVCVLASFASRWAKYGRNRRDNKFRHVSDFIWLFPPSPSLFVNARWYAAAFCNFYFHLKEKNIPFLCVWVCVAGTYVIIQLSCLYIVSWYLFTFQQPLSRNCRPWTMADLTTSWIGWRIICCHSHRCYNGSHQSVVWRECETKIKTWSKRTSIEMFIGWQRRLFSRLRTGWARKSAKCSFFKTSEQSVPRVVFKQ